MRKVRLIVMKSLWLDFVNVFVSRTECVEKVTVHYDTSSLQATYFYTVISPVPTAMPDT